MLSFVYRMNYLTIFLIVLYSFYGFAQTEKNQGGKMVEIKLTSAAFREGDYIPKKYTCDGENVSPPLEWGGIPAETKSIALICDDPDAPMGTWVHWVIFNIPSSTNKLSEKIPSDKVLEDGATQGNNDFRKIGYGGPCPPDGTHRYFFKIYALDKRIELAPGATKAELLHEMNGHILAEGKLMGRYSR
jgi:Raf kinase inhibitor-like YbhB/YbcL family protein